METRLVIEPHIHGAFGIDFNKASVEDVLYVCKKLLSFGIGGVFPTLVTDSVENIKRQIQIIKQAAKQQTLDMTEILGIHLEGIFLNPNKKGIHNSEYFLPLSVDNYKQIEDDFIKIITVAPELDNGLLEYLSDKNIKVQAGHCEGGNLSCCHGVTHLFNAMKGISHRDESTALSAFIDDNIYTEVIADGVHLSDEILKLIFKTKPSDKIILISDALPITHSDLKQTVFAGETIYYDGIRATSKEGTIAGSTTLVSEIVKILGNKNMFQSCYIENPYIYHNIDIDGKIEWDDEFNIISVIKNGIKIK